MGLFKKDKSEKKDKKEKKSKKNKKQPKVEQVFESNEEEKVLNIEEQTKNELEEFLGVQVEEDDGLTETQRNKKKKLDTVKSKISKILQSSNIEIVDENFGDEYEKDSIETDEQSEQDYDELKSLFGEGDKKKKQELTLTIDDFDYAYVGQYLEEYDLMRMKNIKRVKLIRKKNPKLRKALIAISLVLVVALGGVLGYFLLRETPVYLKSVTLNQTERTYYENEIFDYTGLYFIAEYSDGRKEIIELNRSHLNDNLTTKIDKTGDEKQDIIFNIVGTANLFFTYNGFNTEYVVNVIKKEISGMSVVYSDDIFELNNGDTITSDMLQFIVDYGAFGKAFVPFANTFMILVDGSVCTYTKDGYVINTDVTSTSIITIRTEKATSLSDGTTAILKADLDKSLNFMNMEKES